jgi:type IV pilus assembly protein PilC
MERRPREFDAASCALARAGEASGALDLALGRIAALLERRRALHKRIAAGLAYPSVVSVVAIALVGFLTASVVPTISGLLRSSGAPLPWFTKVLLLVGGCIVNPVAWVAAFFVGGLLAAGIAIALRVERVRAEWERALLRVPVIGAALKKADTASCARTLSALLRTGVGIVPALALVCKVSQSALHRRALEGVAQCVASGRPVSVGFAQEAWYQPTFVALARAGEEAGALDDLLARAAEYQEAEVDAAVTALSAVIEPVLVVVLGAVVGAIVAAILIPLYSAIGRIQ